MPISILISPDGAFMSTEGESVVRNKGKSLVSFPDAFTIIDLETTGLFPQYDSIIEASALRVRGGEVVETFSSLVKPYDPIDSYIEELTGITNKMLESAPSPEDVLPAFVDFIGDDIVIGYNVNFDVNFLYDWSEIILKCPFKNDYIDEMRIARKALPELKHHRLKDVSAAFGIEQKDAHRSLSDCETALLVYNALKEKVSSGVGFDAFAASFKKTKFDLRNIQAQNADFDESHPLFGKHCVFTGTLAKMTRAEAAQIVANFGGICDNNITKKTNFLILGNNDYCSTLKDGKSNKQKKAEEYKLGGIDIEIIPESVFYDLLEE